MNQKKFIEESLIPLKPSIEDRPRTCFVVFSSREQHIKVILDCIERAIEIEDNWKVVRLDIGIKPDYGQYSELIAYLKSCAFAIIVLDGLRPNVVFEYGVLTGLGKPCITLREINAQVDVNSYLTGHGDTPVQNPPLTIKDDFSDIVDRYQIKYDKTDPKATVNLIKDAYKKLKPDIEEEFIKMSFPDGYSLRRELKHLLEPIATIIHKEKKTLTVEDGKTIEVLTEQVEKLCKEANIVPSVVYYAALADTYKNLEQYNQALKMIEGAIELEPSNPGLRDLKGSLLFYLKKYDEAMLIINEDLVTRPEDEILWHNKGLIFDVQGNSLEAKHCYKKGVQFNKKCPVIHYLYASALLDSKDYEEALNQCDLSLKLKPTEPYTLLLKGNILNKLCRPKEAKEIIEEAISFDNRNPEAWKDLGDLELDDEAAIRAYTKALELDPEHSSAACNKANRLIDIDDYSNALSLLYKSRSKCPRSKGCPSLELNIGRALSLKGEHKKALSRMDGVIKKNQDCADFYYDRGVARVRMGDNSDALSDFDHCISADSKNPWGRVGKALALINLGRVDEAIPLAEAALEMDGVEIIKLKRQKVFRPLIKHPALKGRFES